MLPRYPLVFEISNLDWVKIKILLFLNYFFLLIGNPPHFQKYRIHLVEA